jgi:hypothetical protein
MQVKAVALRRAPAFTFFSVKIPLKTAGFEEKIYLEVEEVEKGREKGDLRAKLIRLFRPRG